LDELLKTQERKVARVLYLHVPDTIVQARILKRRTCNECSAPARPDYQSNTCAQCRGELVKRVDDNAETFKKRLELYHNQTQGVLAYYADRVVRFDATQTPDIVGDNILMYLLGD
jgi:adenylate kinase